MTPVEREDFLSMQPWWIRLAFRTEPYRIFIFFAAIGIGVLGSLLHVELLISIGAGLFLFVWLPLRVLGIPARLSRQGNRDLDL
jgi:hypothetical protein